MKKYLLTILLTLSLFITSKGQDINTDKYKDYKPCSECLDKWEKSSDKVSVKADTKEARNGISKAVRNIGTFVITAVGITIAAIIYKKLDETVTQN